MIGIVSIPADTYHADDLGDTPSLSASIAHRLLTQSPAHARAAHPRLNPAYVREEEQKFDIGTAAHAWLLEGRDAVAVCEFPDWRSNAAKEQRDLARAADQIPLLGKHYDELMAMCNAVSGQLDALEVAPRPFSDGKPEQTLVWSEGDVPCRARLDWLRDDLTTIDDLKTTSRSANPESWTRSTLWSIGAHVQAAFYLRGLRAVTGSDAEFRWVVVETAPPYALSVVSLAPQALAVADDQVSVAIRLWRECLETDVWPGYPTRTCYAEMPAWLETAWLVQDERLAA